jgi:serine protease Do
MMRLICAFVLLFFATVAQAQTSLVDEFDARFLTSAEKRLVQAALAFSGDYVGLLDGDWGKGSQLALEIYTRRTANTRKPRFDHVRIALANLEAERLRNGWQTVYLEHANMSYAFPFTLLQDTGDANNLQYGAPDGQFRVYITFDNAEPTNNVHRGFMDIALPGTTQYGSYRADRLITGVTLPAGLKAYVRSDIAGPDYLTLAIVTGPAHWTRMALMAASLQRGDAPDLTLPPGSVLAGLMNPPAIGHADPPVRSNPFADQPAGAAAPGAAEPSGTGTGFYINNTDIVTAAHVIEGCALVQLASGAVASVISSNTELDLAVLSSPLRTPTWLELSGEAAAVLGEPVTALGYPYLGQFGQGLTVTGGNVSALPGGTFGDSVLMISAPVQPGNSGGPLLNGDGAVIGVVVARIDDMVVLEATGTLPQNMNFAVTNGKLTEFLKKANVLFPAATGRVHDMAKGVPEAVSGAVVPLFCFD